MKKSIEFENLKTEREIIISLDYKKKENSENFSKIQKILDSVEKKTNNNFLLRNIIEIFFLILFNIFYIISLKTCNLNSNKCLIKYKHLMGLLPLFIFISTFLVFIYFFYHLMNKNYVKLSLWICNLLFYYLFFTGYQWSDHGGFNFLLSLFILILLFLVSMIIFVFRRIYFYNKKIFTFSLIIFLICLFGIFYLRFIHSKSLLFIGYKNTKLENTGKLCRFKNFYINWHEGTKYFLLFLPKLFSKSNNNYKPSWKKDNFSIYEYPDTRKFDSTTRSYVNSLAKKVQESMIGIPSTKIPESELWVDFREKEPKVKIQIKKNPEFIKKKQELLKKNNLLNPLYKGLYIFFIDGLSRSTFFRLYKKNFLYLEKFYNNKNSKYEVFQFFRFHSIKPYTGPNVGLWRYGSKYWDNNFKKINPKLVNIEEEFSRKGYISGYSSGFCNTKLSEFLKGEKLQNNITPNIWDHEFIAPGCDEEIYNYDYPFNPFKGPYSFVRRKLFNKDLSSHIMDYMKKFHSIYKNQKTISSVVLSDNHELSRDVPLYIQNDLLAHFEDILEKNLLNGKSMIFLSDHGQHMTPILINTESGRMEMFTPLLNLILPRHLADLYRDVLKKNEQKVVGMMDIRRIMKFLASGVDEGEGVNFLKEVVREDRGLEDVGVRKRDWQCFPPE